MTRDDRYFGDVVYEVWRRGGDSDAVDRDRLADYEYDGYSADEAASAEMGRQRHYEPEPEPEPEVPHV